MDAMDLRVEMYHFRLASSSKMYFGLDVCPLRSNTVVEQFCSVAADGSDEVLCSTWHITSKMDYRPKENYFWFINVYGRSETAKDI